MDLLGLDNLTSAFGLLLLFRGVTTIVGPPLAGVIFDATKKYDISFYMAGGFLIMASVVSFGAQMLHSTHYYTKNHENPENQTKTEENLNDPDEIKEAKYSKEINNNK